MMKLSLIVVLVVAGLALASAEEDICVGGVKKWPLSTNCRSYYVCPEKKVENCFPLFRRFNRVTLECDWAWRVDCQAVPQVPTDAPAPAPTPAPGPAPTPVPPQA